MTAEELIWMLSGCTKTCFFFYHFDAHDLNTYFQDSEILEQIDRDVKRTHPDISFFSSKSNQVRIQCLQCSDWYQLYQYDSIICSFWPYQESLRRILIIFSKLNPSIRYVQGMNEVLAPLFYVFKNDPDPSSSVSCSTINYFYSIVFHRVPRYSDFPIPPSLDGDHNLLIFYV